MHILPNYLLYPARRELGGLQVAVEILKGMIAAEGKKRKDSQTAIRNGELYGDIMLFLLIKDLSTETSQAVILLAFIQLPILITFASYLSVLA